MASVAPGLETGHSSSILNGGSTMNGSTLNGSTMSGNNTDFATDKLAMMKLRSSGLGGSDFSSSNGARSSGMSRAGSVSSKAVARTKHGRSSSSASRRNSSFIASHRSKMASEMTSQAENKFFSLMDLMSAASKEASSLREIWTTLMSDRESFNREREEMLTTIDEFSEIIEAKDGDHQGQHRELLERRKEVEKLVMQVTTAMAAVTEQKQKVADRDNQLEYSRREYATLQNTNHTLQHNVDKVKFDYDAAKATVIERESERDSARLDADRQRNDARAATRDNSELKSKISELTSQLEQSRKENSTLTERVHGWERERTDFMYEKDRLVEELRRMTVYRDEASKDFQDSIDKHDAMQRELHKVRETVRHVELERDEYQTTIDRLRHDNNTKTTRLTEIESLQAETSLKLGQSKREVTEKLERLSILEIDISSVRTQLDTKQEEWRVMVLERDNAKDDLEVERRKVTDNSRQVITLQEQVSRTDNTVSDLRAEILTLTDNFRETERERDNAYQRVNTLQLEINAIKEKLTTAIAENETLAANRDAIRGELDDVKYQYQEVTETMTDWGSDSEELRQEIESMRSLIHDLREQKELAISARNAADRERDASVSRYQEKCRELERLEESKSSQLQQAWASNRESKMSSSRVTSKSTVINHGHGESEQ